MSEDESRRKLWDYVTNTLDPNYERYLEEEAERRHRGKKKKK